MTLPHLASLPSPATLPVPLHRAAATGGLRIGDAERDRTCEVLAAHYAAGRITPADLDERSTLAVEATTQRDLLTLTCDLPALHAPAAIHPAAPVPAPLTVARPATPTPAASGARTALMVAWGILTAMAAACTMLLLFGVSSAQEAGLVWLAAFGAVVASSGITFFVTRPTPRR